MRAIVMPAQRHACAMIMPARHNERHNYASSARRARGWRQLRAPGHVLLDEIRAEQDDVGLGREGLDRACARPAV